jgi:AmmeMemoRadiSam system protein B
MKILSQLNSKTIVSIIILILVLAFILMQSANRTESIGYHQSRWNEYAPEVERSLQKSGAVKSQILKHVYGLVVSHHIPTTIPKLVEYYDQLKQTQDVKNFIIIGPDHTNSGKAPITTSNYSFITDFGELRPNRDITRILQDSNLANIEEEPFELEHSIGSQILVISKIFPDAKVTPIILRSNTSSEQAISLGKKLANLISENTVIVASVDFSHYLSTNQAGPIDQISGEVIRNLDLRNISSVKADSSKSVLVFMQAMIEKKAVDTDRFTVLNTNDLMQNSDYTTGYVFGYWGVKK